MFQNKDFIPEGLVLINYHGLRIPILKQIIDTFVDPCIATDISGTIFAYSKFDSMELQRSRKGVWCCHGRDYIYLGRLTKSITVEEARNSLVSLTSDLCIKPESQDGD